MITPDEGFLLMSREDVMTEFIHHFLYCAECGVFRSKVANLGCVCR